MITNSLINLFFPEQYTSCTNDSKSGHYKMNMRGSEDEEQELDTNISEE